MTDLSILADARNAMAFSAILMSCALFPDAAACLSSKIARSWKRIVSAVGSITSRKKSEQRPSFWEIDMTKLEP